MCIRDSPNSPFLKTWIASQYNNFGRVHARAGHVDDVDHYSELEKKILLSLLEVEERDQTVLDLLNAWYLSKGHRLSVMGMYGASNESLLRARDLISAQLDLDAENILWVHRLNFMEYYLADGLVRTNQFEKAKWHLQLGRDSYKKNDSKGILIERYRTDLHYLGILAETRLKVGEDGLEASLEHIDLAFSRVQHGIDNLLMSKRGRWFLAGFYLLKIQSLLAQDELVLAEKLLVEISAYTAIENLSQIPQILIPMRDIFTLMGKRKQALRIQRNLYERGYVQTAELPA
ncbi:MAG: hypothetical protein KUG56_02235, partial [Kordiimonadaceae bacterium]|nr:hypothetical protein [Kordiimonadaceae bacterium]